MKSEFSNYLETVGITRTARYEMYTKIEEIIEFMEKIAPEPIEDLFISDSIDPNNRLRSYYSLWLFSKRHYMEARNLQDINQAFFVNIFDRNVSAVEISRHRFNWELAKDDSVLVINVNLGAFGGLHIRAAGENCNKLRQIYENRIKPNFTIR